LRRRRSTRKGNTSLRKQKWHTRIGSKYVLYATVPKKQTRQGLGSMWFVQYSI
jgi:hypothetical protein